MLDAIANSLPMSIGVALSPLPIAAVLMMLLSRRATVTAPAFLAGWVLGILAVGGLVLVLPGVETERGQPTVGSAIVRLGFGALLLWLALRQWRRRPGPETTPETPRLLARLDGFGFPQAFVTGLLLAAANPKNLLLTAAGAAAIDAALTATVPLVASLLVFAALASLSVLAPVLTYFVARERSEALFGTWKEWLVRNNAAMMVVLFLVFGVLLIARGLHWLAVAA